MRFELAGSFFDEKRIFRTTLVQGSGAAFGKVEFTAAVPEIWVTLKVRLSLASQKTWIYGPDTPYIIAVYANDDTLLSSFYMTPLFDGINTLWRLNDTDGVELLPKNLDVIVDQWTSIELQYKNGDDQNLYVNGLHTVRYPTGIQPDDDVKKIFIGQGPVGNPYLNPDTPFSLYFKDIRIGTSRGQGDLFTANLDSDNSFTLWSLLGGAVSHIVDPFLQDDV